MRGAWPKYLVAIVLAAAAAGWEIASPWLTLSNMRDAAREGDSQRVAEYINFPRVRSNLQTQLVDLAETRLMAEPKSSFLRRVAFHTIIDPVVDAIVTPEALRLALSAAPIVGAGAGSQNDAPDCGVRRDGLMQFRLRCARLPSGRGDLVFARRGWGWEMVGIDLPADYGDQVPQASQTR